MRYDVDGNWEHDGAVLLSRNAVQRLKISELEKKIVNDNINFYLGNFFSSPQKNYHAKFICLLNLSNTSFLGFCLQ